MSNFEWVGNWFGGQAVGGGIAPFALTPIKTVVTAWCEKSLRAEGIQVGTGQVYSNEQVEIYAQGVCFGGAYTIVDITQSSLLVYYASGPESGTRIDGFLTPQPVVQIAMPVGSNTFRVGQILDTSGWDTGYYAVIVTMSVVDVNNGIHRFVALLTLQVAPLFGIPGNQLYEVSTDPYYPYHHTPPSPRP